MLTKEIGRMTVPIFEAEIMLPGQEDEEFWLDVYTSGTSLRWDQNGTDLVIFFNTPMGSLDMDFARAIVDSDYRKIVLISTYSHLFEKFRLNKQGRFHDTARMLANLTGFKGSKPRVFLPSAFDAEDDQVRQAATDMVDAYSGIKVGTPSYGRSAIQYLNSLLGLMEAMDIDTQYYPHPPVV
ncbi:hypothetical protein A2Z33_00355 [Candidatus Gottesmanbacteria bacterium RBG_16_52_11]|uniref:Uncharacterized protein n=1 Tax=Candidatus Gottesmanbacteria bacterium RBG_16_52_11 TaxID=1798374 RepID=A0A1F5YMS2_9BACT|nr:MAG: hypothetical protein A2Z33_00355 [Candidatus Gottesmanbacteria bacterium RBG_16_52_11]